MYVGLIRLRYMLLSSPFTIFIFNVIHYITQYELSKIVVCFYLL